MSRKSGHRFSEKLMLHHIEHEPEKWSPLFRKDHAPSNIWSAMTIQPNPIAR
jgi:hypothetical protein